MVAEALATRGNRASLAFMKPWTVLILAMCLLWTVGMLIVSSGAEVSLMKFLSAEATASWGEAIGGFCAIAAVFFIATNEARERKARERDAQRNAFITALIIADSALETAITVVQNFSRPRIRSKVVNDPNQLAVLEFIERDLLNFQYASLADGAAIGAFHRVRLSLWSIQKGLLDMKAAMAGASVSAGMKMTPDEVAKFCQERVSEIDLAIDHIAERAVQLGFTIETNLPIREDLREAQARVSSPAAKPIP
jgi:hypothetical protein